MFSSDEFLLKPRGNKPVVGHLPFLPSPSRLRSPHEDFFNQVDPEPEPFGCIELRGNGGRKKGVAKKGVAGAVGLVSFSSVHFAKGCSDFHLLPISGFSV